MTALFCRSGDPQNSRACLSFICNYRADVIVICILFNIEVNLEVTKEGIFSRFQQSNNSVTMGRRFSAVVERCNEIKNEKQVTNEVKNNNTGTPRKNPVFHILYYAA